MIPLTTNPALRGHETMTPQNLSKGETKMKVYKIRSDNCYMKAIRQLDPDAEMYDVSPEHHGWMIANYSKSLGKIFGFKVFMVHPQYIILIKSNLHLAKIRSVLSQMQ